MRAKGTEVIPAMSRKDKAKRQWHVILRGEGGGGGRL